MTLHAAAWGDCFSRRGVAAHGADAPTGPRTRTQEALRDDAVKATLQNERGLRQAGFAVANSPQGEAATSS
jgi:hypothetical protein